MFLTIFTVIHLIVSIELPSADGAISRHSALRNFIRRLNRSTVCLSRVRCRQVSLPLYGISESSTNPDSAVLTQVSTFLDAWLMKLHQTMPLFAMAVRGTIVVIETRPQNELYYSSMWVTSSTNLACCSFAGVQLQCTPTIGQHAFALRLVCFQLLPRVGTRCQLPWPACHPSAGNLPVAVQDIACEGLHRQASECNLSTVHAVPARSAALCMDSLRLSAR